MKRFHNRKFFEHGVEREFRKLIQNIKEIVATRHFIDQYKNYGYTPIPKVSDVAKGEVFEYYRDDQGNIVKFCVRISHMSECEDMVYILSKCGKIITGWRNSKNDKHRTLDMSVYEEGECG